MAALEWLLCLRKPSVSTKLHFASNDVTWLCTAFCVLLVTKILKIHSLPWNHSNRLSTGTVVSHMQPLPSVTCTYSSEVTSYTEGLSTQSHDPGVSLLGFELNVLVQPVEIFIQLNIIHTLALFLAHSLCPNNPSSWWFLPCLWKILHVREITVFCVTT